MLFNLREIRESKQCLLLQLLPIKGGVEQGPAVKFPALKLFGTEYEEEI